MKVGIVGRTNVGKSTFFKALTLEDIQIEDRPFTTIEPNHGVGYVAVECPEKELGVKCEPRNAQCRDGVRMVPLDIIDVAGLIEGASAGKGLGNKFLSDAMEADGLVEVIDISGKTNGSGSPVTDYDPALDVRMVKNELSLWVRSIILRTKMRSGDDVANSVYRGLSGIKVRFDTVKDGVKAMSIKELNEDNATRLCDYILERDKPIVVACNKMDASTDTAFRIDKLSSEFAYRFLPCSAASELTLKEADKHGFISYVGNAFRLLKQANQEQQNALDLIKGIMDRYGGTGVQNVLNTLVLGVMKYKIVYTVEDEKKLCDGRGRVLPDAYIVGPSATPKDVAGLVHSSVLERYKGAIDCRTGLKIKNDEPVKNGQIIKIIV